jgi:cytochrome oxidase Cu insertion factor (SCO1/SenC/PrrC family)
MARRAAALLAAAAALGAGGGLAAHTLLQRGHPPSSLQPLPEFHGQASWAAGVRSAPLFSLPAVLGGTTSLASLRGRVTLIAFLDSRCLSGCPFLGQALSDAERALSARARPAVLVVSIDPAADSAAHVRAALRRWHAPSGWSWLSGSVRALERIWHDYGVELGPGGAGAPEPALYLLDRRGDERAGYLPPVLPNFLELDIRELEAHPARAAPGG